MNDVLKLTLKRKVTPSGIEFEGLQYNDAALTPLMGHKDLVTIRIDQANLATIDVLNPFTNEYITVAVIPDHRPHAQGVSLWQRQWNVLNHRNVRGAYRRGVEEIIDRANKDIGDVRNEAFEDSESRRKKLRKKGGLDDVLRDDGDMPSEPTIRSEPNDAAGTSSAPKQQGDVNRAEAQKPEPDVSPKHKLKITRIPKRKQ